MTQLRTTYIIIAALVIALLFTAHTLRQQMEANQEVKRLHEVAVAILDTTRNELGQQTAIIESFEVESKTAFLSLRHKDATIRRLQETVSDYSGKLNTAIAATSSTTTQGGGATTVTYVDSTSTEPVYSRAWEDAWEDGWITATKDSIFHRITQVDSVDVTIGRPPKWNPFKKSEPEITLESANPNVTITNLRSLTIKGGDKRFGLAIYGGYGIQASLITGDITHGVQVGVGASWRIYP